MSEIPRYGQADATYLAAGEEAGVRHLVDRFYTIMETQQRYQAIWKLHPKNNDLSRDKLARFLCGWMGGPLNYSEKYGPLNIPSVHAHLNIDQEARDLWLNCMRQALVSLAYPAHFIDYLIDQLSVPADRIRINCERLFNESSSTEK